MYSTSKMDTIVSRPVLLTADDGDPVVGGRLLSLPRVVLHLRLPDTSLLTAESRRLLGRLEQPPVALVVSLVATVLFLGDPLLHRRVVS